VKIRVVLVDDQELVRAGLAMVVESSDDMVVVGEAGDGSAAIQLLTAVRADVVLMDVRMPRMNGIEATRELTAATQAPKIIVLTTFDVDEYAYAALRAGASGFLLKDATASEVLAAIRAVHGGDAVIAPSTTRRMLDDLVRARRSDPDLAALAPLTQREREVFFEIATGYANPEIAARLHVSEATVKTHVGHIMTKLGLRDRIQIVIFGYDHGLVPHQDREGDHRPPSAPAD
jgi:DNA-binding NarL/FixJ family response regulator